MLKPFSVADAAAFSPSTSSMNRSPSRKLRSDVAGANLKSTRVDVPSRSAAMLPPVRRQRCERVGKIPVDQPGEPHAQCICVPLRGRVHAVRKGKDEAREGWLHRHLHSSAQHLLCRIRTGALPQLLLGDPRAPRELIDHRLRRAGHEPGAPQAVIDELAPRAPWLRQQLRERAGPDPAKQVLGGRVKVAVQPNLPTRFIFPLPDGMDATAERRAIALSVRLAPAGGLGSCRRARVACGVRSIAAEREGLVDARRFQIGTGNVAAQFPRRRSVHARCGRKAAASATENGLSIAPPQSMPEARPVPEAVEAGCGGAQATGGEPR